jgi:DNA-3-methyladenine glycosylase I
VTTLADGLLADDRGFVRCAWSGTDPEYCTYHDEEWGRPVTNDRRVFEKIVLEGFQSGLSWRTILHKRSRFRQVFCNFDPASVARFANSDVERLLLDAGIVRHRGKIEAAIHNANAALSLIETKGSLAEFVWSFVPPASERPSRCEYASLRTLAKTPASERLSKALRQLGFRFVGPTTCYAMMQAIGLVNDHVEGCSFREDVESERTRALRKLEPQSPVRKP